MTQCTLERVGEIGVTVTTTWIPAAFAEVDAVVPLLMNGATDRIVRWRVVRTHGTEVRYVGPPSSVLDFGSLPLAQEPLPCFAPLPASSRPRRKRRRGIA